MAENLTFSTLQAILTETFQHLPDPRTGANTRYTMADAALGAFSVFFTQSPSFLAYQRDMQRRKGDNNAHRLFGVAHIPTDAQIRNLLDPVDPAHLRPPFWAILERLLADGEVAAALTEAGRWMVSLDGTQYFGSPAIHCPQCTVTERAEGTRYAHSALIPVLGRPGASDVLALEPEFIKPQDGAAKQDSEQRAAARWVARNGARLAAHRATVLADDLHCHQPFVELLRAQQLDFILTCKPSSHPTLYEEVALLDRLGAVGQREEHVGTAQGRERWTYRFAEHVPLREPPGARYVNWCELTVTHETTGEVRYHNAWATNWPVNAETVGAVARTGRARWKVENEGYNVLKRRGYCLEHNYGHGQQHLAAVLVTLVLLAFLSHTVLGRCDRAYQRVRAELGPRRTFFEDLRALTRYLLFASWEDLLRFMVVGLEIGPP